MRIDRVVVAVSLLLFGAGYTGAQGQDSANAPPAEWMIGMSLGVPGMQRNVYPMFATFGLQFTEIQNRSLGADLAIGTMPYLLLNGSIPFGFRGGLTVPFVSPHLIVVPSSGVSVIGGMGAGGAGGLLGLNTGIAAIVRRRGLGLRTGVTLHFFPGLNRPVWLAELGFVGIGNEPP